MRSKRTAHSVGCVTREDPEQKKHSSYNGQCACLPFVLVGNTISIFQAFSVHILEKIVQNYIEN